MRSARLWSFQRVISHLRDRICCVKDCETMHTKQTDKDQRHRNDGSEDPNESDATRGDSLVLVPTVAPEVAGSNPVIHPNFETFLCQFPGFCKLLLTSRRAWRRMLLHLSS
jgi:hypothetical protein